ncbi:MAG TPA: ATP-binding protein [Gemmataceae bacterium]|nr:ATP-binding protein [Gemmataceae bacterium]
MDENLSIFKKGLLLVGIPLLTQFLFLGMLVKIRGDQAEAQRWAIHSKDVMARAEGAFRLVIEANGDLRAFAVSGDPKFDEVYRHDRQRVTPALAGLRHLISDNSSQQEKLDAVRGKAEEVLAWLDEVRLLIGDGKGAEALRHINALEGKRHIDDMRAALDRFLTREHELDVERQDTLQRTAHEQNWALVVGGVLALAGAGVLLLVFSRSIGRRLAMLAENARRLAAGKALSPPLRGRDEISRLDRTFRDMVAALAQKDRDNEMFVYSVSHDLRAPLVNLQGFSQELATVCADLRRLLAEANLPTDARRRAVTLLDRDAAESVRFIQTAVTRLAGIIDALLRLSRVGRVEYRWQMVDVRAAVVRVVESFRDTIAHRGAEVTVGDLPPAWGDPLALEQVFANLVANALNYLDPQRPGRIEVGSRDEPGDLRAGLRTFYVKDNGLGIPEGQQGKLFLAFQRLHPEAAAGEGIGLALVRRVVERHGGRVWLESAPGAGSTFFVALPAGPPQRIAGQASVTANGRPAVAAPAPQRR